MSVKPLSKEYDVDNLMRGLKFILQKHGIFVRECDTQLRLFRTTHCILFFYTNESKIHNNERKRMPDASFLFPSEELIIYILNREERRARRPSDEGLEDLENELKNLPWGLEKRKSCRFKNECPSYSGWCEDPKQDFSRCIPFLINAYNSVKKELEKYQELPLTADELWEVGTKHFGWEKPL